MGVWRLGGVILLWLASVRFHSGQPSERSVRRPGPGAHNFGSTKRERPTRSCVLVVLPAVVVAVTVFPLVIAILWTQTMSTRPNCDRGASSGKGNRVPRDSA